MSDGGGRRARPGVVMMTMRRAFARGLGHGSRRPPLSGTPPPARLVRAPHLHEDLLEEAYVRRGTAERGPAHEDERVEDVLVRRADELRGDGLLRGVGVGSLSERKRTGPRAGPDGDDDARERERPGACLGLARRGLGVRAGGVAGVLGGHHRERRDGGSGRRTRRARSKLRGRLLFLSLGTPVGAALGSTETEQAPPGRKKRQAKTPTRTGTVARTVDRWFTTPPRPARAPARLPRRRVSAARPPPPPPTPSRASLPRPSPRTARPATSRRAPLPPRRAPRRRRRPRPARRRVRETSRVSPSALAIDRSPHSHHDRTALSRRPPPCPPRPNPRSPRTCTPSSASPRRRRPRRSAARTATSSPRRVREGSIPASFRDRPERDRSPSSRGPPPPLPRPEP